MRDIFTLLGTIAINASDANKTIDDTTKNAKQSGDKIQKAFEKIGSAAVACGKVVASGMAVGAAAMGALLKASIGEYADYEQLVGGVETLFKNSSDKVMNYANNAYKTAGLSANDYMSTVTSFSASLLQGLGGDTEAAADIANMAITDMSDNANKMGTSMKSIQDAYQGFAKQNYTMLDNLKLGYGGTQAEMARLINDSGVLGSAITVTAETVNQVSFDKIIEAIHVIQNEMDITGTTAKEASTTISGSFSSVKSSWTNLLAGLAADDQNIDMLLHNFLTSGETLAENVVRVLPKIRRSVERVVENLTQYVDEKIRNGWNNKIWPFIQKQMKVRFGVELPSWAETVDALNVWWYSNNAYQKIKDVCKWTLGAFVDPEAESWVDSVQSWWTNKAQPTLTSITQWTFGELVLPAWVDMIENVTAWWTNDFKPGLAKTTEWFTTLKFPTWEELSSSVSSWWASVKSGFEKICKFYVSYDINRTYSPAELEAASDWTIDTTAGATTPAHGTHANGLDRVPFDGYRAILHRNEAVLTANEAALWRSGAGSDSGTMEEIRRELHNVSSLLKGIMNNTGREQSVVLDTGALVGQITPRIDVALGSIASRRGRG